MTQRFLPNYTVYLLSSLIFLGGFLVFAPPANAVYEISNGSVKGLYHLENTDDSSGNGYNLSNNGSTAFATGKLSNAADQGANNTTKYLSISNDLGIGGGSTTLAAWVNFNSIGSGSNVFLFQGDATSKVEYYLYYNQPTGHKKIETTMIYLRTDLETMRRGVEKLEFEKLENAWQIWHKQL